MGQLQTGPRRPQGLPLGSHPLFATEDLDEARDRVAQVYCDHRLEVMGRAPLAAQHNRLDGQDLSVNVLTYGAKTQIAPGPLEQFYLFQFPLRGHASVNSGARGYEIGDGRGGVLNPDEDVSMIWSEHCVQLMLQIDRRALEQAARAEFGLPQGAPLRFDGAQALTGGEGRSFLGLLQFVISETQRGAALLGQGSALGRQLERTLLVGLLQSQVRLPVAGAMGLGQGHAPRMMRLAEEFMRENLGAALMIEDIASAAGTSVRSLQAAFRARHGCGPMTVLRDMRLERAWEELSNPGADTRVTDVATGLGFFHLGRFSEHYRRKFGCSPVETLRAALRA
ncbi:AraC family transcriptional regulator [Yangia mangrovi]|uniref:AraC family transcriptional regulator n=2 Tax=Alloyangia mangrovi TaxID=1779329 RepID=A0ABT2KNZ2_9RHOB|nr:AraC family transcriptional regulator [Alloyangia mangrovi]